jgi:hypothetical protein
MITENDYRVLAQLSYINYERNSKGEIITKFKNKKLDDLLINEVFESQNQNGYKKWQSEIDKIKNDWKIIEYENNNYSDGFVGVAFQNVNTDEIVVGF